MSAYMKMETENGTPVLVEIDAPKSEPEMIEYYAFLSVEFKRAFHGGWSESHAYYGETFKRSADNPAKRSEIFPWLVERFWNHNSKLRDNGWTPNDMKILTFTVERNDV